MLIAHGGIVEQVGVTDGSLAGSPAANLALIKALETIDEESVHVSGPLQALDDYWADIGARNFAGAFGHITPDLRVRTARHDRGGVAHHSRSAVRLPHLERVLYDDPPSAPMADLTR